MRNALKHGLALLVTCGSIAFATGAGVGAQGAQGAQRKDEKARVQERLTERHRRMHAASRGPLVAFHLASPAGERDLPYQKEHLQ
ncbi:MAG: hypothetical protein JWQ76_2032 [Ramlibacter sp.]|nr:hypothetical protein [Ramlibacter sp.]